MIPTTFGPMLYKLILPKIMELIKPLIRYKDEPNDADLRIDKLEVQIMMLAKDNHPPMFTEEDKKDIINRLEGQDNRIEELEEFKKQVKRKKAFKRKDG